MGFDVSRQIEFARALFECGFRGILQSDGTNKYNDIIAKGATAANCWAHVHCKLEEAWKVDPKPAEFPMGVIKSLFDIERLAATLSEDERNDLRQRLARPKLDLLKDWLDDMKFAQEPKSKLMDAVSYTLNRWPALLVFKGAVAATLSIRPIASTFGISPGAVQRQLEKLESGGILVHQFSGNTKNFRINPRSAIKNELTDLLEKILTLLPEEDTEKYFRERRRPRRTGKTL